MKDLPNSPHFAIKIIDRKEVIKKLNGDEARFEEMRAREIDISNKVCSLPYCLKMYHEFTEDRKDYIIYEVCPGGDLQDL